MWHPPYEKKEEVMEHAEIGKIVHSIFLPELQKMEALDWAIYVADKNGLHAFGLSNQRFLRDVSVHAGTAAICGIANMGALESTVEHTSVKLDPKEYQELITGKKP